MESLLQVALVAAAAAAAAAVAAVVVVVEGAPASHVARCDM